MPFNLLEMVKNFFTSEFASHASSVLGENTSGVSKALTAIIPTSLAGILNKATSSTEGANNVFDAARNSVQTVTGDTALTSNENIEKGSSLVSNLFGGNQSGILGSIAGYAGIKESSASSLMSMALPAIMGILGKHAEQNNLSASGLSGFLSSQKDHIMQALPSGLGSIGGMLGLGSIGASAAKVASNIKSPDFKTRPEEIKTIAERPTAKWLVPLIVILIIIALLWYFSRSCNETKPSTASNMDTTSSMQNNNAAMAPDTAAISNGSIHVTLPNGKELQARKGGIEDQLVTFLNSDWKSLSEDSLKNRWFDFDNLNFNTGNAILFPESEKQLDNIAEILKAYPDAKIKIGGYTDASGNAASNKKLSQARADAAKNGLDKRDVSKQVTGAEGYGSQFAKYPASASDAERALDRHVSVSVRK